MGRLAYNNFPPRKERTYFEVYIWSVVLVSTYCEERMGVISPRIGGDVLTHWKKHVLVVDRARRSSNPCFACAGGRHNKRSACTVCAYLHASMFTLLYVGSREAREELPMAFECIAGHTLSLLCSGQVDSNRRTV